MNAGGGLRHAAFDTPQTLAYGFTDSPNGLAVRLVEKDHSSSDCGGEVDRRFTRDELLAQVMLYRVAGTIGSSIRLLYEGGHAPPSIPPGQWLWGSIFSLTLPAADGASAFTGPWRRGPAGMPWRGRLHRRRICARSPIDDVADWQNRSESCPGLE